MGERTTRPEALAGDDIDSLRGVIGAESQAWEQRFSTRELVGLVGWHGADRVREGAAAEVQRRLINEMHSAASGATAQTEQVIKLTNALKWLTWVLVGFGGVQVVIGVVQIVLMLRGQ
jgi:hypothetical protein